MRITPRVQYDKWEKYIALLNESNAGSAQSCADDDVDDCGPYSLSDYLNQVSR